MSVSLSISLCSKHKFFYFSCRKFRDADVPSSLFKLAPASCAIYVISKGKVQSTRPAGRPETSRQRSQKGSSVRPTVYSDHTQDSDADTTSR